MIATNAKIAIIEKVVRISAWTFWSFSVFSPGIGGLASIAGVAKFWQFWHLWQFWAITQLPNYQINPITQLSNALISFRNYPINRASKILRDWALSPLFPGRWQA